MDKWLVPVAIAAAVVTYSHVVDRLEGLENGKTNKWKKWRFWDKKKGGTLKMYDKMQAEYKSRKAKDRRKIKTGDLLRTAKLRDDNPYLIFKNDIWRISKNIDKITQYAKKKKIAYVTAMEKARKQMPALQRKLDEYMKKKNASVPTAPAPAAPETPAPEFTDWWQSDVSNIDDIGDWNDETVYIKMAAR